MHPGLVLNYLDDVAFGDTASIVLVDSINLEATASQLGLEIKRSKCEVVGHTPESRSLLVRPQSCLCWW